MKLMKHALAGVIATSLIGCVGDGTPSESSSTQVSSSAPSQASSSQAPISSAPVISSTPTTSSSSPATMNLTIQENATGFCGALGIIDTKHTGFTGAGFVDTENQSGADITWKINASQAGAANITVRFANGGGSARSGSLDINGAAAASYQLNDTGAWATWQEETQSVNLQAGENTLRLVATGSSGLANIDAIVIDGSGIAPLNCANQSSSTPASSQGQTSSTASSISVSLPIDIGNNSNLSPECIRLVTDNSVNWDESGISSEQEIVKCLAESLGQPIGYGENARGGFDAGGNSNLVVIKKGTGVLPEKQLLDAISTEAPNWIVFDKDDFAGDTGLAMYRLHCEDASVLSALGGASTAECLDHNLWCSNRGINSSSCAATFFNDRLNDKNLPIRNPMVAGHTTIDGRGSNATFLFSGFKIGADSSGASTYKSQSVIITHLDFLGAGHTEDHGLDPDMLRSTGESQDIWIHKNTFSITGDSAFDVKVGAFNITMSFNRIVDVKRSTLHGSSDSRTINEQITTTMHNNMFITTDSFYDAGRSTGRRVPLLRRGKSHMFNNVFVNYWKDFASIRVGGQLLLEDNIFLGLDAIQSEKDDPAAAFDEWVMDNLSDAVLRDGGFTTDGTKAFFASQDCRLNNSYQGDIVGGNGAAVNMNADYSALSKRIKDDEYFMVGQDLVDYPNLTAGKQGQIPYNSPLSPGRSAILAMQQVSCLN